MFPHSTIITYGELKKWLYDFSNLVADKVFEKMPYSMWRHLNQKRSIDSDVFIDWDNIKADIYFPSDSEINTVCKDDSSFGAFIFENFLNDWAFKIKSATLNAGVAIKASGKSAMAVLADTCNTCNTCNTVSFALDTKVDKAEFDVKINEIKNIIDKNLNNNEEKKDMNTFNFDFGPVNGNAVHMSMYGLAVKNKVGAWVSYDAKSGEVMDVDILNFDGAANFLYKMPVAMKDIAVGDVVIHHGAPMFVVGKSTDAKGLVVVDVIAGERKEIMLAKSPFGFNFATKVVNFLDSAMGNMKATADNPFGNMWMLMAMSDNKNMSDMLPFMMMANGGNMDPAMMMCMAMSSKGGDINPMMMMAMMNMSAPVAAPAHECKCGGNCGQHNQ